MTKKQLDDETVAVLRAWRGCRASARWPRFVDTVSTTTWRDRRIASLAFRGECFDIFDVERRQVVSADELPGYVVEALDWKVRSVGRVRV